MSNLEQFPKSFLSNEMDEKITELSSLPELPLNAEEIDRLKVEVEESMVNLKKVEQLTKGELRNTKHLLKKMVFILGLLSASSCSPNRAPSPYDVARLKNPPSASERDKGFAVRRNNANLQDQNSTLVTGNLFSDKQ